MPQSLRKTTLSLFILRLLRICLSVITLAVSAKYFGVSIERDVWVLTTAFISALGAAVWGPINERCMAEYADI